MQATAPIGIFDSGIGGLTVASAIAKCFPQESIIYFGDTAHLPYGEKSIEAIQHYSATIVEFLIAQGCKLIVIACNSASAAAYELLKDRYSAKVAIIDVISPLAEYTARQKVKKVGVIATKATTRSDIYAQQLMTLNKDLEVSALATTLLVPMIEEGFFDDNISHAIIHKYLSYPDFEDIDALLLACTHYPLIRQEIQDYFGDKVQVWDSINPVVEKVSILLNKRKLSAPKTQTAEYKFWVTDYTKSFEHTTRIFYGETIKLESVQWKDDALVLSMPLQD
ncbi:MAG: glutamate racemase [Aureispira sp.]|nr:glutamate racemase [Aureispira sp.]